MCILFTLLALYWLFFSCIRREETIHGHWVSGLNVVKRPHTLSAVWLLASKSEPPVDFYLMFCLLCLMFCCVQNPRLRIMTTSLFPLGESLARLHHMFGPQSYFRPIVSVEPSYTCRLQKVKGTPIVTRLSGGLEFLVSNTSVLWWGSWTGECHVCLSLKSDKVSARKSHYWTALFSKFQ
jgi:hypothetical protein